MEASNESIGALPEGEKTKPARAENMKKMLGDSAALVCQIEVKSVLRKRLSRVESISRFEIVTEVADVENTQYLYIVSFGNSSDFWIVITGFFIPSF